MTQSGTRSNPGVQQSRRFDGMFMVSSGFVADSDLTSSTPESWVELSSQPSSSSLSSIRDEIITTGLRVAGPLPPQRQRPNPPNRSLNHQQTAFRAVSAKSTSSQEEYDESESEDDALLTSSTEHIRHSQAMGRGLVSETDTDDEDNVTALGRLPAQAPFQPQPNLFSHPPSQPLERSLSSSAALQSHPHADFTRPSFTRRSQTRAPRRSSFMSPSMREDNDAALRASLTTLLSCAAAARALPKNKEEVDRQRAMTSGVGPSTQPMALRLVPETDLMGATSEDQAEKARPVRKGDSTARSATRSVSSSSKSKRSSSTGRQQTESKKKKKTAVTVQEETYLSPTLLTWAVSAGVVVLISVVGFGAGYVIGREVGQQEGISASVGSVNNTAACGREAMRSSTGTLRRFKWSAVGKTIAASA